MNPLIRLDTPCDSNMPETMDTTYGAMLIGGTGIIFL
jgi:hypothetical protein